MDKVLCTKMFATALIIKAKKPENTTCIFLKSGVMVN